MDGQGPENTADTAGQSALCLLIPFPIAFLVTALMSDLAFWTTGASMWATASLWLLGATILTLPFAAIAGFGYSALGQGIRGSTAWQQVGHLLAIGLVLFDWYPRYRYGAAAGTLPFGLWLSLAAFFLLMFNGWIGEKLVSRHRIGAADISSADASISSADASPVGHS